MKQFFKRLFIIIAFIVLIPFTALELPLYSIRWLLLGKSFPEDSPLCFEFLHEQLEKL